MPSNTVLHTRVPAPLALAVAERADVLGLKVCDVVRAALVREVTAPVDQRSRAYVELWLAGEINPTEQKSCL